jgi:hypothetical protein
MSIPTVVTPTYELKLQSIKHPVKYRPYLVKEEKLLLMAQEGGDEAEVEAAMKEIVRVCTFGAIDPDTLPSFDLELLFLNLRAKSVNNIVELRYECKNVPPGQLPLEGDDKVCHNMENIKVDLDTIKVVVPEGHTRKVMVTDKIGCVMRYPTNKHIQVFKESGETDAVTMIADCIESIYDTDGNVHETKDAKPEEVVAFVESLSLGQVSRFRAFFDTLPHLSHTIHFKCSKCGYTEDIVLSELLDFFD